MFSLVNLMSFGHKSAPSGALSIEIARFFLSASRTFLDTPGPPETSENWKNTREFSKTSQISNDYQIFSLTTTSMWALFGDLPITERNGRGKFRFWRQNLRKIKKNIGKPKENKKTVFLSFLIRECYVFLIFYFFHLISYFSPFFRIFLFLLFWACSRPAPHKVSAVFALFWPRFSLSSLICTMGRPSLSRGRRGQRQGPRKKKNGGKWYGRRKKRFPPLKRS